MDKIKFYLFNEQIGRDKTFVLCYKNKYCLFSFDEDCCSNLDICILTVTGNLHWTKLNKLQIPDTLLFNEEELPKIGKCWLKNYVGTY